MALFSYDQALVCSVTAWVATVGTSGPDQIGLRVRRYLDDPTGPGTADVIKLVTLGDYFDEDADTQITNEQDTFWQNLKQTVRNRNFSDTPLGDTPVDMDSNTTFDSLATDVHTQYLSTPAAANAMVPAAGTAQARNAIPHTNAAGLPHGVIVVPDHEELMHRLGFGRRRA